MKILFIYRSFIKLNESNYAEQFCKNTEQFIKNTDHLTCTQNKY